MPEQWCPFAVRRIGAMGPDAKCGYPDGIQGVPAGLLINAPKRGEIKHDSTGPLDPTLGVLDTHPINSWHFTVDETGIYQHYPVDRNCWHGNDTDPDDAVRANVDLVGIEHTRVNKQMPLTPHQVELTTTLTAWLMAEHGATRAFRFNDPNPTPANYWLLCEHNEVGNSPTACPSGRIPWREIVDAVNAVPPPPSRQWLYGNEVAGCEIRGQQLFYWHLGVEVDAVGDYEGVNVGAHYHNEGGAWRQVLP